MYLYLKHSSLITCVAVRRRADPARRVSAGKCVVWRAKTASEILGGFLTLAGLAVSRLARVQGSVGGGGAKRVECVEAIDDAAESGWVGGTIGCMTSGVLRWRGK